MPETRGIGDNRTAAGRFDDARKQNLTTGILLLCKEALVTAIQDRRLERAHLRVLAAIATCINGKTAMAWPDRRTIAAMISLSPKTVSNLLTELKHFGYLIADRVIVEEADGKRLMCFTFGNIDHETIRQQITEVMHQLRAARDGKSPSTGNLPAHGEQELPRPRGTSAPAGNFEGPEFPTHGAKNSPPAGRSNSYKEQGYTHAHGHGRVHGQPKYEHGPPEGAEPLAHGAYVTADLIWHPRFTISLAAARMQFSLTPDIAAAKVDAICKAAAIQWAAAIEGGQPQGEVVPKNIIGALLAGTRKGIYAAHEHEVRLANTRTSGKQRRVY